MKKLKNIIIALIVGVMLASCTPKSAMQTKAIILDDYDDIEVINKQYVYKVKVPAYGIVASHHDWRLHDQGDTILIHDRWRDLDIK